MPEIESNGADTETDRPQWWWCVPLAVTLVGLPLMFAADSFIVWDLLYGNCAPDDNACDGPYTDMGKLRVKVMTLLLFTGQIASFSAMWGTTKSRKAHVRARRGFAYGGLVAAPAVAGLAAWLW